jgi:glycerol dehydrogenase-like iron-containing ADH family enzyme
MQSAQKSRALGHDRRAFIALLRLRFVSSRIVYSSASHDASMSSTVSIVDNDGKNLDADSIQDPEQILELEFIHAVPKSTLLPT